jgi:hypothetical protein
LASIKPIKNKKKKKQTMDPARHPTKLAVKRCAKHMDTPEYKEFNKRPKLRRTRKYLFLFLFVVGLSVTNCIAGIVVVVRLG